ncbi:MAG TPA: hypothetical protein VGQ81_10055 [Acidobacteriota bacterium]|jgi:hypothetical protein|nr:hypothetical protein [Acidobacteriota bacterium]
MIGRFLAGFIFLISAICILPAGEPSLVEILSECGKQLQLSRKDLKNYVCREEITYRVKTRQNSRPLIERGKFEFRVLSDQEERLALDPASEKIKPLFSTFGGFLSAIYGILGPENQRKHSFVLKSKTTASPSTVVIETEVPPQRSETLLQISNSLTASLGYRAEIVLERETLRIMRMEKIALHSVEKVSYLRHLVDYDLVPIGEAKYNLPVKQEIELVRDGDRYLTTYRYSVFKRFQTEATVKFK